MTLTTNHPALTQGFNEVELILAKTMEYLSIPSVVGHEQYFLNHLFKDFKKLGLSAIKHPGLLEISGDKPNAAIICAHIDRHGLISLGNDEYVYAAQYIREIKYGENNNTSRKTLENIIQRFKGEKVFAYNPKTGKHLGDGVIEICAPQMYGNDAIFYVQGLHRVKHGIPLAYARTAREKDGCLRGQLDNTISLSTIYALFHGGFKGTALLSTEEEIGKSWIHLATWLEKHRMETHDLLVLDTSPYVDEAPIEQGMVILRGRDMNETYNAGLTQNLKQRCTDIDIPYQVKDEILLAAGKTVEQLGSTELGKLIKNSEKRWSGATVQIPTLAYHTSNETTSRAAIRNYIRFLNNILVEDPLALRNTIASEVHQ